MEKRNSKIIKVAVIGPESTGKSEMCRQLAKEYNTIFVPEFARNYLTNLGKPYTYEDVIYIGEQQMLLEKEYEKRANKILFCDTNLITIKIWLQVVFNKVPFYMDVLINKNKYDKTFLMDIDLPWENDPLREHPNRRKEILNLHLIELESHKTKFNLINGVGTERLQNAKNNLVNLNP
ncbi:MAG: ATP-binding protein [Bacteroidetes bacterium]|nr:ATP-binding protein [Bacteroidota bacterium]